MADTPPLPPLPPYPSTITLPNEDEDEINNK